MPPKSILDQLNSLPPQPGVYLFRDKKGVLLYVGKAKRLRDRIRSYFRVTKNTIRPSPELTPQKQLMVRHLHTMETILVSNETEALLLESELIKRHHPPYNIVLADDKSYVYIKFDFDRTWADVTLVRRPLLPARSRSILFGPFPSARHASAALRLAKRIFPYCQKPPSTSLPHHKQGLNNSSPCSEDYSIEKASRRHCGHGAPTWCLNHVGASNAESRAGNSSQGNYTASFSASNPNALRVRLSASRANPAYPMRGKSSTASRPCFNYHLGRCPGACIGLITPAQYERIIRRMLPFFRGHYGTLVEQLKDQMQKESRGRRYESAAKLRDQITALRAITASQSIIGIKKESYDVMSAAREGAHYMVNLFKIRDGALTERLLFPLAHTEGADEQEALEAFINLYYARTGDIPPRLFAAFPLASPLPKRMKVSVPQRGKKKKLLLMGQENARQELIRKGIIAARTQERATTALTELQQILTLPHPPTRIETYDISNIQGTYAVGAMTVLHEGMPLRSAYRRFVIKTVKGSNDPAMMQEVIRRRFLHSLGIADQRGFTTYFLRVTGKLHKLTKTKSLRSEQISNDSYVNGKYGASADSPRYSPTHKLVTNKLTTDHWPLPNLIVIDGGLPQLNAARTVLAEFLLSIPVLAVAKWRGLSPSARKQRGEEWWYAPIHANNERGQPIKLPTNKLRTYHSAPLLLDRARDDAHRFAITHYRGRHLKEISHSLLDTIPGIGPKTARLLLATYGSVEALTHIPLDELRTLIGNQKTLFLHNYLTKRA
ncbi:MAG: excinuclease ABC subunit UvrC [Patescibacteria group bacterium]